MAQIYTTIRTGYSGHEGWRVWSAKYRRFKGMMRRTLHPKYSPDTYRVTVETQKGSIAITITDKEGNVIFNEKDIQTTSFLVKVTGRILVRIEADDHQGSFDIRSSS